MEEEGGGGGGREGEGGRSWRRREREERRRREAGRRSGDGATRADSSRVTFDFVLHFLKYLEVPGGWSPSKTKGKERNS